ncbi:unnamed protein product [Prorocentrum cordatum]|uniref:Uncharacterized protein n=1 Tax=Prorocentrum cordatum TaxID=2364126 RepID=A0ABN9TRF8_9DINO|nr:unnamed protein product [Polarella glacialis]
MPQVFKRLVLKRLDESTVHEARWVIPKELKAVGRGQTKDELRRLWTEVRLQAIALTPGVQAPAPKTKHAGRGQIVLQAAQAPVRAVLAPPPAGWSAPAAAVRAARELAPAPAAAAASRGPLETLDGLSLDVGPSAAASFAGSAPRAAEAASPRSRRARRGRSSRSRRTARRAVGARLQASPVYQVYPVPYDPSRVRPQIQLGVRVKSCVRSDHGREFKIPSSLKVSDMSTGVRIQANDFRLSRSCL